MAKRKAGVNDIIYELDNDDIVISSDEEGKESKIGRFDKDNNKKNYEKKLMKEEILTDFINLDSPNEPERNITPPNKNEIGGKNKSKITSKQNSTVNTEMNITINDDVIDITDNKIKSCQNTIIYNDEIVVDSPASNTDLGVVGCENRSPLVSIRFKDNFLAHNYKKRIKEFIVTLLKAKNDIQSDSETDNELEIWPEDLVEEEFDKTIENPLEDNLFFLDTTPSNDMHKDIPVYHKATNILSNVTEKEATPQTLKRGFTCFNCEGSHLLRDCPLPRDNAKINVKRKAYTPRPGRYHVEDEQKYGHLIPGRISGDLRHALGLKRHELPLHIYRMRLLGYPPGWLEEARISHSGITLFDSSGRATLDPDEEEGEVCEPGSKDKFDIKKILDFPGFNVIASSRYAEEAHLYGLPEMSEQDSKIAMLQILAPNAMKAYKRKKLSFFPSASKNLIEEGQAEMELDSGDEVTEFPSIPPLPDDEPPAPPPPPPPATEDIKEESNKDGETLKHIDQSDNENQPNNVHNASGVLDKLKCDSNIESDGSSDLEVIEVVRVNDIPIPEDDLITIDDDDKSSLSSGRNSPSLDDLEKRKQRLLDALKGDSISVTEVSIENNVDEVISNTAKENKTPEENQVKHAVATEENTNAKSEPDKEESEVKSEAETVSNPTSINETQSVNKVQVKNIVYGTPVINVASPFQKIPSSDKFAKDICDVINFENLPNSVGKYKKICKLLKKVKSEVDRIQDS